MLIVQQYKSFNEIDWEHQTSLQSFLAGDLPSFEWLKNEEERLASKGTCFIFLFFCDKHNIPIGLAFSHLTEIKQQYLGLWQKLSSLNKKKSFQLKWLIPGLDVSCFFHKDYMLEGQKKVLSLGKKITKKDKFDLELFKFPQESKFNTQEPYFFSSDSSSLPCLDLAKSNFEDLYTHLPGKIKETLTDIFKNQDQLEFHKQFQAEDFVTKEHFSLAKESHVEFIALTYNGRPMFIGEFWPGKTDHYFFDFHVRPAGGELELKYYYYFFLYKIHEYCLKKKQLKTLKFLRNSLYDQSQYFGYQLPLHQNVINYSLYKNIGQVALESMSHENKRTTV